MANPIPPQFQPGYKKKTAPGTTSSSSGPPKPSGFAANFQKAAGDTVTTGDVTALRGILGKYGIDKTTIAKIIADFEGVNT